MRFHIEKLGCIEKADIELGDLTILCGDNNAGKTYISYAIYGFLNTLISTKIGLKLKEENIKKMLKDGALKVDLKILEKDIPILIDNMSKSYTQSISSVFNTFEEYFSVSYFQCIIDDYVPDYNLVIDKKFSENMILKIFKEKNSSILEVNLFIENKDLLPSIDFIEEFINIFVKQVFLANYLLNPFIIVSERNAIPLFYRELDQRKNEFIKRFSFIDKVKDIRELFSKRISRYPLPIEDAISFVRDIPDLYKQKGYLIKEHPELEKELIKIAGGDYKVEDDQVFFFFKKGRKTQKIPLYMGSSTVKSLLNLNIYIKHLAKKGDILMIDEPELNLHPANQRRMARLFVKLIKAGVKVFVTTHSDYLIKELNNLIILGNEFQNKAEIMKKYGYTEEDVLDRTKLRVYIAEKNTLKPAPINELGIEVGSFDYEISEMNDMFDDMTETMDIAYE